MQSNIATFFKKIKYKNNRYNTALMTIKLSSYKMVSKFK